MTQHLIELKEVVKNSSSQEKQLDWKAVENRVVDQVILRAMTCVQIASKLVSHYKVCDNVFLFIYKVNTGKSVKVFCYSSRNDVFWQFLDLDIYISLTEI